MMTYEQSVEMAMSNNIECYAMVGELYVSSVSIANDRVSLMKDYRCAMDLGVLEQTEWLINNMEGVKFYRIQVQARSYPLTLEEAKGQ